MILPDVFWSRIKKVQRIHQRLYSAGMGWLVGWIILLLEHTGRKSGKRYTTPLQFEKIDDLYYVGAGRGPKADWYRNVQVNPDVHVQVGRFVFNARAECICEADKVLNFLKFRFKRHPLMMGLMMRFHNMPMRPNDDQLLALGKTLAIVALHPVISSFQVLSNSGEHD